MEYPNLPERKLIDIPANSRASRGTAAASQVDKIPKQYNSSITSSTNEHIVRQVEKAEVLSMKNHTTQHLHYDDTFGDCTYSFHISIIVLEIAHTVFDNATPMIEHTVFHICRLHIHFSHRAMFFSFHLPFFCNSTHFLFLQLLLPNEMTL